MALKALQGTPRAAAHLEIDRQPGAVAVDDGDEDQPRRGRNERRDQPFLDMIEHSLSTFKHA